jgi:heme exporter protein A
VVAGLLPAFSGKVERRGALALCDEHAALDADLTLGAALSFWAGIDGAGPDAVAAALDAFGLAHLRDIPVRMLSTGQRKRAALARTYASGAAIWLLDEPANGLDQQALALLGQAIADHLGRGGIVLAASHQPLPFAPVHDIDLAAHVPAEEESA